MMMILSTAVENQKKNSASHDFTTCGTTSEPSRIVDEVVDVSTPSPNKGPSTRIQKMHPQDNIIGSPSEGVHTRSRKLIANACFISKVEPKNIKEALLEEYWINA